VSTYIGKLQGEPSAIAESVERSAMSVSSGRAMILLLIQIASCFLTRSQGNLKPLPVFRDDNEVGRRIANPVSFKGESFQFPDLAIISKDDRAWLIALLKKRGEQGLQLIGSLCKTLDHQNLAIAIDDKTRDEISFGINSPAENGIDTYPGSERIGLLKAALEKSFVDGYVLPCKKPKCDLRPGTVESFPNEDVALIADGGNSTRRNIGNLQDIAPVDPDMAISDTSGSAIPDTNPTAFQCWHCGNPHAHL
jgi:hypothetical protein